MPERYASKGTLGPLKPDIPSPMALLASRRFAVARDLWVESVLQLYGDDPFLTRLLAESTRAVVFFNVMVHSADFDPQDPSTFLTMGGLQALLSSYGLSSPRRIEAIVSRFVSTGYIVRLPSPVDRRRFALRPTPRSIAHDMDWLRSHYAALALLFPDKDYGAILDRNEAARVALRREAARDPLGAVRLLAAHPLVCHFMNREAGMLVLCSLVRSRDGMLGKFVLTTVADRFGVSRTHVRRLLAEAEAAGLLVRSHSNISVEPCLSDAFDRFVADCLSAMDEIYERALGTVSR